jgi:hypothetical protein
MTSPHRIKDIRGLAGGAATGIKEDERSELIKSGISMLDSESTGL